MVVVTLGQPIVLRLFVCVSVTHFGSMGVTTLTLRFTLPLSLSCFLSFSFVAFLSTRYRGSQNQVGRGKRHPRQGC